MPEEHLHQLAKGLQQSLLKHRGQHGEHVTLRVSTNVRAARSVQRENINQEDRVAIESLSYAQACQTTQGLCFRLIFGDQLYATCGDDAVTLQKWVEEARKQQEREVIPMFPDISFQRVAGRVRLQGDEIIPA